MLQKAFKKTSTKVQKIWRCKANCKVPKGYCNKFSLNLKQHKP
jgi:hypothetical protein